MRGFKRVEDAELSGVTARYADAFHISRRHERRMEYAPGTTRAC